MAIPGTKIRPAPIESAAKLALSCRAKYRPAELVSKKQLTMMQLCRSTARELC